MFEEQVKKIAFKLGCSSEEVEKRVADKVKKLEGFLTQEAALKLVAGEAGVEPAELGSNSQSQPEFKTEFKKLSELKAGENASAVVIVEHVFAPKRFEKNGRRGKLCRIVVGDSSSKAALVLWGYDTRVANELERGDVLEIKNAAAKASRIQSMQTKQTQQTGLELHANLLTQLKVHKASEANAKALKTTYALPAVSKPAFKLRELNEENNDVDCFARVIEVGEEKEFKRESGVRRLARCMVSDGSAQIPLVLWDGNAEVVRRLDAGDAVKVEGAYARRNAVTGELELNLGWRGHVALNPLNHSLPSADVLLEASAPRKNLVELVDGSHATIEGEITQVYGGKAFFVCRTCGAKISLSASNSSTGGEANKLGGSMDSCECGSRDLRSQAVVACEVRDATKALRLVFWGREALRLLGVRAAPTSRATVEAFYAAFEVKRKYLPGKRIKAIVRARKSSFTNELECSVRTTLGVVEPEAAAIAEARKVKMSESEEETEGEAEREAEGGIGEDFEATPAEARKSLSQCTLEESSANT